MKLSLRIVLICLLSILIIIPAVFFSYRYNRSTMSCIFCNIVDNKTQTEFLYQDDMFVAFRDIKPASKYHFLIIPKKHIMNVKSLSMNDKPMIEDMKRIMIEILAKEGQTDMNEISLGFHLPPFNSVKHLHLHGISPKSEMNFIPRWIFRENSFWYKTVDNVINDLPPPFKSDEGSSSS